MTKTTSPHKSNKRITDARLIDAMTTAMIDCFDRRGCATKDDLRTRGFAEADIARLGDKAVAAAISLRPSALKIAA